MAESPENSETPPRSAAREQQFVELLTRHDQDLRRYVRSLLPHPADAADVFQRTAISLWRKFDGYDPAHPFFPWACRFAYFEVLNHRKRAARDRLRFSEDVLELLAEQRLEEDRVLALRRQALDHCLTKLSREDRDLLQRRYAEDATVKGLAEEFGASAKQLYKALERIRRGLSLCIDQTMAKLQEGKA